MVLLSLAVPMIVPIIVSIVFTTSIYIDVLFPSLKNQ